MSRNLAASIRARLKQRADATKPDFNLILTHHGLERLLYRLSISPHAGNHLLKGALLFLLWYDQPHRPTRDADLLGFGPDDMDTAVATFRETCALEVGDGTPKMSPRASQDVSQNTLKAPEYPSVPGFSSFWTSRCDSTHIGPRMSQRRHLFHQ